jgi:hypothetical protein
MGSSELQERGFPMEANDNRWSHAQFNARGVIAITVPIDTRLHPDVIRWAIKVGHRLKPWACEYGTGKPAPSAEFISEPECKGEDTGTDRLYEIWFRPPFLLKPSQMGAYYNHVQAIAREVKKFYAESVDGSTVLSVVGRADFLGVTSATEYQPVREENVKDLHVQCSLRVRKQGARGRAASDDCGSPADTAVVDPDNGNRLFRCPVHRGVLRLERNGNELRGRTATTVLIPANA